MEGQMLWIKERSYKSASTSFALAQARLRDNLLQRVAKSLLFGSQHALGLFCREAAAMAKVSSLQPLPSDRTGQRCPKLLRPRPRGCTGER